MQRIQYNSYGGPEVMSLENFTPAEPKAQEIRVNVKASSINPADWVIRNGDLKIMTGKNFPRTLGMDFSGVVESIGSGVSSLKVGDEVLGATSIKAGGALAEQLVIEAKAVVKKPAGISFEQAACLPVVGATAWTVVEKANFKKGQTLFVNGCYGAVGQGIVQLARLQGVTITGSCNPSVAEDAKRIGVDTVIDYNQLDLASLKGQFDVVVDTADKMTLQEALNLLTPKGVYMDLHPGMPKMLRGIFSSHYKMIMAKPAPAILEKVTKCAQEGTLQFNMGEVVPLSQGIQLITEVENGKKVNGKAVITMG